MSEPEVKPEPKESGKRDRSPKFPYIGLGKALERAETLYSKVKRYEARVADIAKDWDLSPKSSSTDRTVAALQSFGLIEDSGSGDGRKIKLSELGARILADQRPGVKEALLAEAALKPPIMSEYAARWEGGRPDDPHALSLLQFEGSFTEEGAKMFLRVFDETIRFAKKNKADQKEAPSDFVEKPEKPTEIKVGDLAQWVAGGVEQLAKPARIVAISDDNDWVWVEGSQTGLPAKEIAVVSTNTAELKDGPPPPPPAVLAALKAASQTSLSPSSREEKFSLAEGDVTIRYPEELSADSVSDLEDYLKVFLKKAQREAGISKKGASDT